MSENAPLIVGAAPSAGVRLDGAAGLAPEHARLEFKGGRLYLTALAGGGPAGPGAPPAPGARSGTWIDGVEVRPGVAYLVAPGARLAFGGARAEVRAEFAEPDGGGGGLMRVLMRGMAASDDVRDKLK